MAEDSKVQQWMKDAAKEIVLAQGIRPWSGPEYQKSIELDTEIIARHAPVGRP